MQIAPQTLIHRDSKPWTVQVWLSFTIAVFLCAVGLSYLPGKDLDRAFMVMGYFFCLSDTVQVKHFILVELIQKFRSFI